MASDSIKAHTDVKDPVYQGASPLLVAVLLSGALFSGLIFVAIGPILPTLAQHFNEDGKGAAFAQWTMTAPAVGLIIGGLIGGWLFDRVGPKRLLPVAYVVYGVAGASGAVLESQSLLLASRLIIGFCAVVISLGTTVVIAERFDDTTRAKMLGYKNAIAAGSGIGGMLIAGQIAAAFGWRATFLIYGVALLFVFPAIFSLRGYVRAPRSDAVEGGNFRALTGSWFIYFAVIAFGILVMAPLTQLPFLLHEIEIRGPEKLSLILGSASVGSTIGAISYGWVFARLKTKGTFLLDMVIWATGMIVLGTTASEVQAGIGCLITGVAAGIFVVHMSNTLVARVSPPQRGRAIGMLYVALFAGDFLTPLVLLPLAEALGRHTTFLLLAIPCAVGFAVIAGTALRRTNPARVAAA